MPLLLLQAHDCSSQSEPVASSGRPVRGDPDCCATTAAPGCVGEGAAAMPLLAGVGSPSWWAERRARPGAAESKGVEPQVPEFTRFPLQSAPFKLWLGRAFSGCFS